MLRLPQVAGGVEVVVFAICLLLSLVLLVLPDDIQVLVADRLQVVLTAPYWKTRAFVEDVVARSDENARLKARIVELEFRVAAGAREARGRAGPQSSDAAGDLRLLPCKVLVRQHGRFATMIKIHALEPGELKPYQAVVTTAGIVGRIRRVVDERTAWVELLVSPGVALGVEVQRTGLLGVLRPRAGRFMLDLVGRDEDVTPGDQLYTSGIAELQTEGSAQASYGLAPRGLPVGTVKSVALPSDAIFKEIVVEPAASFQRYEAVFVVVEPDHAGGVEGTLR